MPFFKDYISYKNDPNKTWVKTYIKMTSESSSGAPRLSFMEITGMKHIEEVDNQNLVLGYVAHLQKQKKFENSGREPSSTGTVSSSNRKTKRATRP